MVDSDAVERAISQLLTALGEDVSSEDLRDTPARASAGWIEMLGGRDHDPVAQISPLFAGDSFDGQVVSLGDISFTSVCEHHLLPFSGKVRITYRSSGPVAGLSALVRTVHVLASRLQLQERLTQQVADALVAGIAPGGVLVEITARHGCISDRGVRQAAAQTTTVVSRGCYSDSTPSLAMAASG